VLSFSSVLPNHWFDFLIEILLLSVFAGVGRLLIGSRLLRNAPSERLALSLVAGMLFSVGIGATFMFGRIGVHTLVPLVLLGAAVVGRWRFDQPEIEPATDRRWHSYAALGLALILAATLNMWFLDWRGPDGDIRLGHGDLGYFSMMTRSLAEAKVSNLWTAVSGSSLVEAGLSEEQWYHWGPLWMGMLIAKLTGLPALESVLNVGSTVMLSILIFLSGVITRALTRWNLMGCVLIGLVSICTLTLPQIAFPFLVVNAPFGSLQHCWESLALEFSYQFEAIQVMAILLLFLRGRYGLALTMVFCATVSSPHFVGGMGIAAGVLVIFGWLSKDRILLKTGAAAAATILFGWAVLHWVIDVKMMGGLHTEGQGGLFGLTLAGIASNLGRVLGDLGVGLLLGIEVVLGWVAMIRIKKQGLPEHTRVLGWMAVASIVGGLAAFHLFQHAEKLHFTGFPMAVLALPISIWGMALWASQSSGLRRAIPALLMVITFASCLKGLHKQKNGRMDLDVSISQMDTLKQKLGGEPFGYYADRDRPWWIPKYSFLAALLDTRCIRLNPLQSADVADQYSRFYNTCKPMELVPFGEGEKIGPWSIKLAQALGIRYILQTQHDAVPAEISALCIPVFKERGFILYQLSDPQMKQAVALKP
jgi:hypothetical protein